MTEKRFTLGYVCGDTGLVDNEKGEWFVENIKNISDLERNWNDVLDKLNELADENKQLKQSFINLIDKKIEEFQNGDYGDLPCNTIHMFLDLKEELEK